MCVGDGSVTEGRRPSFCKRSMQRIRRSERDLKLDLSEAHLPSTAAPAVLREERAESLPPASAFKVTVSTFSVLIEVYNSIRFVYQSRFVIDWNFCVSGFDGTRSDEFWKAKFRMNQSLQAFSGTYEKKAWKSLHKTGINFLLRYCHSVLKALSNTINHCQLKNVSCCVFG